MLTKLTLRPNLAPHHDKVVEIMLHCEKVKQAKAEKAAQTPKRGA